MILTEDVIVPQGLLSVDDPAAMVLDRIYQIGSEFVQVRARPRTGGKVQVSRGVFGSTATTHASGATVTPVTLVAQTSAVQTPPPTDIGEGSGVSIDNGSTTAPVTTIVASGAVIEGSSATLPAKGYYAQDDDPGAVGYGSIWRDTSTGLDWVRNFADDGWDPDASVVVEATGGAQASSTANATSVDGPAAVSRLAQATGTGNATVVTTATAISGGADTTVTSQSTSGGADSGVVAIRNGVEASLRVAVHGSDVALVMTGLPTSDPGFPGRLWVDPAADFVIKVSQ